MDRLRYDNVALIREHFPVRPNKNETRKSSYFLTEIESFIKYNFHFYKVQFIFFHFDTKNALQCPRMTEQEQFEMSMSKSGCAELMVTVCTYNVRHSAATA